MVRNTNTLHVTWPIYLTTQTDVADKETAQYTISSPDQNKMAPNILPVDGGLFAQRVQQHQREHKGVGERYGHLYGPKSWS